MDSSAKVKIYKKVMMIIIVAITLFLVGREGLNYFYTHDSNNTVSDKIVFSNETKEIEMSSVTINIPSNFNIIQKDNYFIMEDSNREYLVTVVIYNDEFQPLLENYESLRPEAKKTYYSVPIVNDYNGKKYIVINSANWFAKELNAVTDVGENMTLYISIINKLNTYDYKLLEKLVPIFNSAYVK